MKVQNSKPARQKLKRSAIEKQEIEVIQSIINEQAPVRGTNPLSLSSDQPTFATARKFDELPISKATKDGLKDSKYISMTAIQRASLPHALCGRDVLGAAKTGSGKTLSFVVPLIERLFRLQWGHLDGLGALVISPTRELALQIFEELRKVGKRHDLSAGLLIGGKNLEEEKHSVNEMNILVCTPGRLLQHMDETPGFEASNIKILVLDEADRILDMGFSATLNAIVANLPPQRQTLLFSATQTKTVSDLARLSLKDPEYVSVHSEADMPTPVKLEQAYMICELHEKMDIIWSFIKTHLKSKVIIFLSTCKQVRFAFEAFRRLRPGVPLRALHGKMNQYKRMAVFYEYCEAKSMVLFATDIAARGLDFTTVDWVVQADCPENVASYIHRVGRTARYVSAGKGLMMLLPSEEGSMLKQLEEAKIPVKHLRHNPGKIQPVTPALQALLSKDQELKEVAQRALVSYLRSVFLQPNKAVFDASKLPAADYALSLGLPNVPKLRFMKKRHEAKGGSESQSEPEEPDTAAHSGEDAVDDLLIIKQRNVFEVEQEGEAPHAEGVVVPSPLDNGAGSSKKKRTTRIRINQLGSSRVVFDNDGEAVDPLSLLACTDSAAIDASRGRPGRPGRLGAGLDVGVHQSVGERAAAARALMKERDVSDRAELRVLRKAQRDEKRAKRLVREREDFDERGVAAFLSGGSRGEEEPSSGVDSPPDSEAEEGVPFKRGIDPAHMDMHMQPLSKKKSRGTVNMSVAEQEALALRLLRAS